MGAVGSQAFAVLILTIMSGVLSLTTVVAAPLPIMLIYRNFGRLWLIGSGLIVGGALAAISPSIAMAYGMIFLATFAFCESEKAGVGFILSIWIATLAVIGVGALILGMLIKQSGFDLVGFLRAQIDMVVSQLGAADTAAAQLNKDALLMQMPSAFVIGIILFLWINAVVAERVERGFQWQPQMPKRTSLLGWRLPDFFVWFTLVTTALAYFEVEPRSLHVISGNVFNFIVLLYFFQGLAVIVNYMDAKKISSLWRTITYVLIFAQFFLLVALLGFADFWVDFRGRTKRLPAETNPPLE